MVATFSSRSTSLLLNLWQDMCGSTASFVTICNLLKEQGTTDRTETSLAASAAQVYCIPLLSGIVSVLQNKYLPTGDMTAGNLRLELTLADAADVISVDAART